MIIAITNWQSCISPVFDVSDKLCLIKIERGREIQKEDILLKSRHPLGRAREMADMNIEILICGAISRPYEAALNSVGIRVIAFICGDLEAVLSAFMRDGLTHDHFHMPGHCGKREHYRFQHRRGRNTRHDVLSTDINKRR